MKRFLKLMGYETKRIFRNKVILVMLLAFSILIILLLFFVQSGKTNYKMAIYTDEIDDVSEKSAMIFMEKQVDAEIVRVDSVEEGIEKIKQHKATFFIRFQQEEDGFITATLYYDESDRNIRGFANDYKKESDAEAFKAIVAFLEDWGIKLDLRYFQSMNFQSVGTPLTYSQMLFVEEIAASISVILMLGIAYSLARDRETNVNKIISYIPIGYNTYLLSKLLPYFILGMLESLVLYVIGASLLGITFQINLFLVWLLSSFFVMSTLSLGLLFSMMKSQISAVFLGLMTILFALFVNALVVLPAAPLYTQIFMGFFPVSVFSEFVSGMVYNGVIIWRDIPIFLAQTVGYYLLSLFILKKQSD